MIIVKLMGGLGNQMFQYAAGRRLAHVHKTELKLDLTWFSEKAAIDTARQYELAAFPINASFATLGEIGRISQTSLFSRLGRLNRFMPLFLKRGYVREEHYHFDPDMLALPDDVYLDGYWQCERYFSDIQEALRNEFSVRTAPDEQNRKMAGEIESRESVSVHVRRGDYISNPKTGNYHGICSIEYYQKAIEAVARLVKGPHYFVFSDDPVWVRKNMTAIGPATFVDHNGPDKAAEDMRLMSLCKHHIIANSSFSWWGAWLCANRDKIVIAPRQWFNNTSINTNDVVPETWIRI